MRSRVALVLFPLLVACGSGGSASDSATGYGGSGPVAGGGSGPVGTGGGGPGGGGGGSDPGTGGGGGSAVSSGGIVVDPGQGGTEAGQLTAAEWRDLDHWDFWVALLGDEHAADTEARWDFYTEGRVPVRVTAGGAPAVDVPVRLLDRQGRVEFEARTDASGSAELFAGLFSAASGPFTVAAAGPTGQATADATPGGAPVALDLGPVAPPCDDVLDLAFAIDTTGSMSDELSYLQLELESVIERVRAAHALPIRTSVNFYRDHGDEYRIRPFEFTTDVREAVGQLREQEATGGGDYPEAVDEALLDVVGQRAWSASARARLLFLVLDAPAHDGDTAIVERLHAVAATAARRGIRIVPVVASGLDRDGELLVRFLEVSTGGTFVFLTDDSGIGNDHLEPRVGAVVVEYLDDLLVRVVGRSLGAPDAG